MSENTENIEELEQAIIRLIEEDLDVSFKDKDVLRDWLIEQVSHLIDRQFDHLLRVLYLIDVNEQKVRRLIQENEGENAAAIISDLILERQVEKIRSRKKHIPKDGKYFSDD